MLNHRGFEDNPMETRMTMLETRFDTILATLATKKDRTLSTLYRLTAALGLHLCLQLSTWRAKRTTRFITHAQMDSEVGQQRTSPRLSALVT